jgi:nucleoid DNA-binding protein
MDIVLLAAELQRFVVQNKGVSKSDFARAITVAVDAHCRKVTKIKGTYQVLDSIMSHVVQGFKAEWQELGTFSVKDKELKNFQQKVNFSIVPAEVLSTALADWYEEDKDITDKMICKVIIDWLLTQVTDDLELLSMIAEYNSATASGAFGYSMNGWNKIVNLALANTDRPVFKIPLDALTDSNIYDQLLAFERGLPKILKNKIQKIHMSENNLERYEIAYKEKFNQSPKYDENDNTKSPLRKRVLVGHTNMADDKVFCTMEGLMLNLIDVIDNPPKITMIQVQDYKVKIFMEFWKGYDFLMNEAVCVADFAGRKRGLGDDDKMKMYYPHEVLA